MKIIITAGGTSERIESDVQDDNQLIHRKGAWDSP